MNKITTLLLAFLFMGVFAKAQYMSIPDSNFRAFLINKYPTCFNGTQQMDTTCTGIVNEINFDCIGDSIKDLSGIECFKSLTTLTYENFNYLSSFPPLPNSLRALNLSNSAGITSLPKLPNSLRALSCTNNAKLTVLPTLPDSLQVLSCEGNSLLALPALPQSIKTLGCSSNNLLSLPVLPNSLISLVCTANHIAQLQSNLPQTLVSLNIGSNPIARLPSLDSLYSLSYIDCSGDANLQCLPRVPMSVNYINFSGSGITCLPNYTTNVTFASTGLPLCNGINSCTVNSVYVNIPDANFRKYLINQIPACFNASEQLDTTCSGVTNATSLSNNGVYPGPNFPISNLDGIQYFKALKTLDIAGYDSVLMQANNLPTLLDTLKLTGNGYLSLPTNMPSQLRYLEMNSNTSGYALPLPSLPNTLTYFSISGTHSSPIATLPTLPNSLQYLNCAYQNGITSLPALPDGLKALICSSSWGLGGYFNNLTTLPDSLQILDVYGLGMYGFGDKLTHLPSLPSSLQTLICGTNDSLFCLPKLPSSLQNLYVDTSVIKCLPNAVSGLSVYGYLPSSNVPSPPISIPVCSGASPCVVGVNYVNIPDTNFAKYLITQVPSCLYKDSSNGYWMDTTCSSVLNLNTILCQKLSIKDLTGIQYFKNLNYLTCDNNQLTLLPALPNTIRNLICNNNQLTAITNLPDSLRLLFCYNNSLTKLPSMPTFLNYLDCQYNKITSLPILPYGLALFQCNNNLLTTLPNIPSQISVFVCDSNQLNYLPSFSPTVAAKGHHITFSVTGNPNLTCLPTLPNNFGSLWLAGTGITCLPNALDSTKITPAGLSVCSVGSPCEVLYANYVNIPDSNFRKYLITQIPACFNGVGQMDTTCSGIVSLKVISCGNMNIADLTGISYFKNLNNLNCNNNILTSLPSLPNTVRVIFASYNQLTSLPSQLPDSLRTFLCNNNKLTALPSLPSYVNYLSCENNQLTALPQIPDAVGLLLCQNNQLTSIPNIPNSISIFTCDNNQLTYLPPFPDKDSTKGHNLFFSAMGNRNLTCLPKLPNNFSAVHLDSTGINCLPNALDSAIITPAGLTVCSGASPCGVSNNYVNIPDSNFANYLITIGKIPSCLYKDSDNKYWMDTTCSGVVNTTNISCDRLLIKDLTGIEYFKNLTSMGCGFNKLTFLPTLPNSLQSLECSGNNLHTLGIQNFQNLITLSCEIDSLTFIPTLPNSLQYLNCSDNNLHTLPILPNQLRTLLCGNDSLTSLPALPSGLTYIYCNQNQIASLPTLPIGLDSLDCYSNNLTSLPTLPITLKYLMCLNNPLSSFPTLPDGLLWLACGQDNMKSLPILPNQLKYFDLENTQITVLPSLPNSLKSLTVNNSNITSLPTLPNSLTWLNVGNNKFTSLPSLPSSLYALTCFSNLLSSLPSLDSLTQLQTLRCDNNSNLACLPKLPYSLSALNISGTKVSCLPNYTSNVNFTYTGLPLCNPTNNSNQCKAFPTVMGKVFGDNNSNGIKDSNEQYIPFVPVKLSTGAIVYTNDAGQYNISTNDTGSFSLSVIAPPNYKVLPTNTNFTFSANNSFLTLSDIALQPIATIDSLAVNIESWNVAVPGRSVVYSIDYRNMGTSTTGATISLTYDTSKLMYDSASIPSVTKNGNTLTWADTLTPNYFGSRFYNSGYIYPYFTFTVKPSVQLGDSISIMANIASAKASAGNNNNLIARNSFDPNSKEATVQLTTKQVMDGEMIDYHVHFQNIGNASARNIVIADTLSPLLTQGLLQMMGSSHNPNITFKNNIIYFEFLNIDLPDSGTNQLKSNGFVHFKLKPVTTLSEGTNIENKASIYFDYNSPVVTNTASTVIKNTVLPVSIRSYSAQEVLGSNGQVANNWSANNELNVAYYNVQRSIDATNFSNLGQVAAKGNGSYSFLDLNAGSFAKYKTIYYRLQIIDKDGSIRFSKVVSTSLSTFDFQLLTTNIHPNPAKNFIVVNGRGIKAIRLIDNLGRVVLNSQHLSVNDTQQRIDFKLSAGVYMAQILMADGSVKSEKVLVE